MCSVDYVNADYSAISHDERVINQGLVRGRRTFPLEALLSRGESMRELCRRYRDDGWTINWVSDLGDGDYLVFSRRECSW